MKGLKDTSVKSKLRILTGLFIGAMVLFGLLAYRTLNQVKIGSAMYQAISDNDDEQADYSIPSQLAIAGRVLVYQTRVDIEDKAKLAKETDQLRDALKAFEEGHTHWLSVEDEPELKELMNKVYEPGHQYLSLAIDSYAPLLLAGNTAEADALRIEKMNPLYVEHEKLRQQFLKVLAEHTARSEDEARSRASSGVLTLIGLGIGASLLVGGLTFYVGNGIVTPLSRTVAVLNEVSKGNLTSRLAVKGSDEIAQMGNALNETIENLSRALTQISSDSEVLYKASDDSSKVSRDLITNSQQTTSQAAAVSSAAEQVSQNVQTVSTAAEEMTASIKEISKNASEAAEVASSAARLAGATNATMTKLSESSAEIGNVIKVITSIAEQTNLLALNATIEAARAGEAGKGFAVVANEVKELAKETAKATEDIGAKVQAIQHDAKGAVQAIDEITAVIGRINDIQNTIASAVEEQTGTTNEISRNVSETAKGSSDIASNITGVASSAKATHDCAAIAENSAAALSKVAQSLTGVVGQFKLSNNGRLGNLAQASQ